MAVALSFDFKRFKKLNNYIENLKLDNTAKQDLLANLGTLIVGQTHERFDSKTDPEGKKWVDWSPNYKNRGKSLLEKEGDLRNSIAYLLDGNDLLIGSNEIYSGTHQYGNKDKNIPARAYLGISAENKEEIEKELIEYLKELGY